MSIGTKEVSWESFPDGPVSTKDHSVASSSVTTLTHQKTAVTALTACSEPSTMQATAQLLLHSFHYHTEATAQQVQP